MKHLILSLAVLCALCWPSVTAAQTAITTTTLTNAITTATPTTIDIVVGSATGMAVNGTLWIDGSVYRILAISGTTITVSNIYRPATHLATVTVFVVPLGAQAGADPVGSCIRSTAGRFPAYSPYTLMFNFANGVTWSCRGAAGSRVWVGTSQYGIVTSATPPQTP